MPLRQTKYGGECPLGVFKVDIPGGGGSYTADSLEGCLGNPEEGTVPCNYFRFPKKDEKFEPAVQCQCPSNITKAKSRALKDGFLELVSKGKLKKTKEAFWKYVDENYRPSS